MLDGKSVAAAVLDECRAEVEALLGLLELAGDNASPLRLGAGKAADHGARIRT